jgi:hypothetical protein
LAALLEFGSDDARAFRFRGPTLPCGLPWQSLTTQRPKPEGWGLPFTPLNGENDRRGRDGRGAALSILAIGSFVAGCFGTLLIALQWARLVRSIRNQYAGRWNSVV